MAIRASPPVRAVHHQTLQYSSRPVLKATSSTNSANTFPKHRVVWTTSTIPFAPFSARAPAAPRGRGALFGQDVSVMENRRRKLFLTSNGQFLLQDRNLVGVFCTSLTPKTNACRRFVSWTGQDRLKRRHPRDQ